MSSYDITRSAERDNAEDYGSYRSMNYGSMPPSLLTSKFEETDIGDEEDRYDDYARSNLVDWGPDTVMFEHERPRGGVNARSGRLQAQYYGHRGDADFPYQPERFDGFMGDEDRDPRGIAVEPDMKELRKQHEARTRFVRWTPDGTDNVTGLGRSESKAMADQQTIFKLVRNRLKVFSRQIDGRREGMRRAFTHTAAAEKQVRVSSYGDAIKDYALTPQRRAAIICREVIRGSRAWCDETADGDFAMAKYTQQRRQRRGAATQSRAIEGGDTTKRDEVASAAATYKACALLMSDIVRRKAQSTTGDMDNGASSEATAAKTAPLERDLTHILRAIGQDAEFARGKITVRGRSAAPVQAGHLSRVQVGQASTPAHHMLNAELIYRAVKPGADMRSIKNEIVRDARPVDDEKATTAAKHARAQMMTGAKLNRVEDADRVDTAATYHSYKTGKAASTKRASTAYDQDATDSPLTQFRRVLHLNYRGPRQSDTVAGMKYGDNASIERHGGVMGSKYSVRSIDRDSRPVVEV